MPKTLDTPRKNIWVRVLPWIVVGLILSVTLVPVTGAENVPLSFCIICGDRGTADAILNVALFMPLGAALAVGGASVWRATLAAGLLSLGIEALQTFIPGRDPSWGDLLFNTAGGAFGCAAVITRPRWLYVAGAGRRRLWLAAVVLVAAGMLATGLLLRPAFPTSTYYGQRAVDLPYSWYRFQVLDAELGGEPLPVDRIPDSREARRILLNGPRLDIHARALERIQVERRIVGIYEESLTEVVRLGSAGDDLVLRYRMGASVIRLDRPGFWFPGVLQGVESGDSVHIRLSGSWWRPCVAVDGVRSCSHELTVGSGWTLLRSIGQLPPWLRTLMNVAWLSALFFPVGLWAPGIRWAIGGGVVLGSLLFLMPGTVGLAPTPVHEAFAALLGLASGYGAGVRLRPRVGGSASPPLRGRNGYGRDARAPRRGGHT